jgi:hypothetical protein
MTTSPAYTKIGLESFQEFSGGVMVEGEEFIPAHVRQLVYNGGLVSPIILLSFLPGGFYQVKVFTDINKFLRWTQKRNWLPM